MPFALLPVAAFTLTRQSQVFVERYLGSALPAGTISHLNYAAKVSQLAMTAGILICTVTFPLVARALAAGDLAAARDRVEKDLGQAAAVVLGGTAFLMACAPSVVSLLFQRGAFGPQDTAATAAVIRVYSFGLPAQALIGVMIRPYFSLRPVVRRADDPGTEDGGRRLLDWFPVAAMLLGLGVTVVVSLLATPASAPSGSPPGTRPASPPPPRCCCTAWCCAASRCGCAGCSAATPGWWPPPAAPPPSAPPSPGWPPAPCSPPSSGASPWRWPSPSSAPASARVRCAVRSSPWPGP